VSFRPADEVERERHDWGVFSPVTSPADGAEALMTVQATFLAGQGHDFHRHPNQEEVIYVLEGTVEQWLEREHRVLGAGDAALIPTGAVHASFNVGDGEARILAVLSPCVGEAGYEVEDVAAEEPWRRLRGGA
jgi:quercetin dioxygenase-like cupin family protein